MNLEFDSERAIGRLMRFLSIEGITGSEGRIAREVAAALIQVGVPRSAIHFDKANEKIPLPTDIGNLIVTLPGTMSGPRRLFMTHLDTVPLCAGAKPIRRGQRIVPAGKTALGGDNRTGVACLVTMLATLVEHRLPHPPMTVLFTVREESGLWGARYADPDELGKPSLGFNVDGGSAREIKIGAVGAERWDVEIIGRAAHAGAHPEKGVSATLIAALALARVKANGWFGKVKKGRHEGTSNVGVFGGRDGQPAGDATNVVTDYAFLKGESRSHETRFARRITQAFGEAFMRAATEVRDHNGKGGKVRFKSRRDYYPFLLKPDSPVVRLAQSAAENAGWSLDLKVTNGGLDANWMCRRGIPTVTFGAGQHEIHTVDEYVDLGEFLEGCRLAIALATV